MLGRKDYTKEEVAHARDAVDCALSAYKKLAKAVDASSDAKAKAALEALEPVLFTNMVLVLDRYFVHRIRAVSGKDGNPLNEVELLVESIMDNGGVLRGNNVIKYVPADSALQLDEGDRITLTAAQFDTLAKAFFAELQAKFV